ncbi:hypothetical protein R1sor_003044 [Riccia sorocarpa]|uniref:Uncharacterized protein n=1 Tax=Riccia sorocarpa TaxID=122646 RepID=A0ABD3H0H3_9MARC
MEGHSLNEIGHEDDASLGLIRAMHVCQPFSLPFVVKALIKLGVPDILVEAGPHVELTATEIASRIVTPSGRAPDPGNLDRLLRLLASHNFLQASLNSENHDERKYALSLAGGLQYFASNSGRSLAPFLLLFTAPTTVLPYQFLHETVLDPSVEPAVRALGMKSWEYAQKHPKELGNLIDRAMGGSSALLIPLLLEKYTGFEGLGCLVDVGGGTGETLALILSKYPHLRGINFDQPHVVAKGVRVTGIEHVGGSFLETCPQGDAVFMKWILHDWSDEECVCILKNAYQALPPHGKLVNMDVVLPEVVDSSLKSQSGYKFDVMMMTHFQGKERTLSQFRKLATDAGFLRVEIVAAVAEQALLEFHKS